MPNIYKGLMIRNNIKGPIIIIIVLFMPKKRMSHYMEGILHHFKDKKIEVTIININNALQISLITMISISISALL